jgi:hypothetical protein
MRFVFGLESRRVEVGFFFLRTRTYVSIELYFRSRTPHHFRKMPRNSQEVHASLRRAAAWFNQALQTTRFAARFADEPPSPRV